mmetsp:Transcript_19386/g.40378  ORF Transcript_19386/g.40378 Transcript_19386/m.40378 type:complete len:299 (-) Transcript_19386:159-1055(-)
MRCTWTPASSCLPCCAPRTSPCMQAASRTCASNDDGRLGLEAGRGCAPITPRLGQVRHVRVLALEDGAHGLHTLSVPHLAALVVPKGDPKLAVVHVPVILAGNVLTTKLCAEVLVVEVRPVHLINPDLSCACVIPCASGLAAGGEALAARLVLLALRGLVLDVHGGALSRHGVPDWLVTRPGVVVRCAWDLASHNVAILAEDVFLAIVAAQRVKDCKRSKEALADVKHDFRVVDRHVQPEQAGDIIMPGATLDHHLVVEVPDSSRQGSQIVVGPVEVAVVLCAVHVEGKRLGGRWLHT